jgi:hypothetical protein
MLQEISKIRDEFPLWEYRGFTKTEVSKWRKMVIQ